MKYVVLRDDDTHALTPIDYLERLYRPFLDKGLPVNLATIPNVNTTMTLPNGAPELYLRVPNETKETNLPIGRNAKLVEYLLANPGYTLLQHGCQHNFHEFAAEDAAVIIAKLEEGTRLFAEAGIPKADTFVAPHDRFSFAGLSEVSKRFPVVSACWYELRKLPVSWWPHYAYKKIFSKPHWQVGKTRLLTHPGSLVTQTLPYDSIIPRIKAHIAQKRLTVIMTHWWEFFRENGPDQPLIDVFHELAATLAADRDVKMVSFRDIANGRVPLN